MKKVKIRVTGKDSYLRDTTVGKVYDAERFEEGDYIEYHGVIVERINSPSYYFIDDVGDMVDTLPHMSGVYLEEVE